MAGHLKDWEVETEDCQLDEAHSPHEEEPVIDFDISPLPVSTVIKVTVEISKFLLGILVVEILSYCLEDIGKDKRHQLHCR